MTLYSAALETLYRLAGSATAYTAWSDLEQIRRASRLSADELAARQWERLRALVGFAYDNVALYRDLWGGAGMRPADIRSWEDFRRLPVLTRARIESRPAADLLRRGADTRSLASVRSSGTTTGRPLEVFLDSACYNHQYANLLYGYYLSGWRLGTPMATVRNYSHGDYRGAYSGGSFAPEPFEAVRSLVYRFVHCKRLLPPMQHSMKPDEAHFAAVLNAIKACRPYLLEGNGYFWFQFARYVLERGERLPSVQALETDEICLCAAQREIMSRAFACPVYDCYGSHELGVVAHGCAAGRGNHVLALSHHVEIVDERTGAEAAPGHTGSVIVTDLINRTTPLIRYETGDLAGRVAGPCPCGSSFPLISPVAGRRMNCVAANGKTFTEAFFLERIYGHEGVVAFQLDTADPQRLSLRLIATRPAAAAAIERELGAAVGLPLHVALVDDIPLEPPGKGRWVRA